MAGEVAADRELSRRPWLWSVWELTARPGFLRKSAGLSAAAMALTMVSGGAVRLTGSGLGCTDWPGCTSTSVVAPFQFHAWVEFGNRLVTVVFTVVVALAVLAALRRRPHRRDLMALAGGLVAGMLGEIVLGGETVLHKLAPQWVMGHFLLGMALLVDALVLFHRSCQPEVPAGVDASSARAAPAALLVRSGQLVAARCMLALTLLVVVLGTVVTSTGPHAGAPGVPRFKFSLHTVAQLHGTAVEALLALTVATLWSMHRARVVPSVLRRGEALLVVLVAQAGVGYAQYFSGDPVLLVGMHIAGATAVVTGMMAFNFGLYTRQSTATPQAAPEGRQRLDELVG